MLFRTEGEVDGLELRQTLNSPSHPRAPLLEYLCILFTEFLFLFTEKLQS